jgi:hypothetical protein
LLLTVTGFLQACATAPKPVQVLEVCPKVPPLELQIESDALEHTFLDRIATFLSGRLPEPISYELRLEPASPTTPRLKAN